MNVKIIAVLISVVVGLFAILQVLNERNKALQQTITTMEGLIATQERTMELSQALNLQNRATQQDLEAKLRAKDSEHQAMERELYHASITANVEYLQKPFESGNDIADRRRRIFMRIDGTENRGQRDTLPAANSASPGTETN